MQISLRNARRLEQEIGSLVEQLSGRFTTTAQASIFTEISHAWVAEHRKALSRELNDVLSLITLRFTLRDAISSANAAAGIDSQMTTLAEAEAKLKTVTSLTMTREMDPYRRGRVTSVTPNETAELNLSELNKQRAVMIEASSRVQTSPVIGVSLFTEELRNTLNASASSYKRAISAIKDQLTLANLKTTVTVALTDDQHTLLISNGITVE